jgi:MoxR-like ATPase
MEDKKALSRALEAVSSVVKSRESIVELSFVALLAGGHLLFEDLPGTGKTTLSIAMARVMGCDFKRVQFTNDLMPSDILGTEIYRPSEERFSVRKGPVFAHILLADEINRATPRTQSALLEAMGERRVTLGGRTFPLPDPFFVIGTQNPMDLYGTYPLPESQLDRFFMRLEIGYPEPADEAAIVMENGFYDQARELPRIMHPGAIVGLHEAVRKVKTSEKIVRYVLDIANASRERGAFRFGLSTRGAIALKEAAQASAFLTGRDYVVPDDVKAVFEPVAFHRLHPTAEMKSRERRAFLDEFLKDVQVPL